MWSLSALCATIGELELDFANPPDEYGINCWWWWLNGNTDRETITCELEAMKSRHFQGAMVFDAGGETTTTTGPVFGGDEWCALFVHALDEAERLGLEIGFNIQSGWNLGGPCIAARHAAKRLVSCETVVTGPAAGGIRLEKPSRIRHGFYRDIAVLAFRADTAKRCDAPIHFLAEKFAEKELGMSATDSRFLLDNAKVDKASRDKPAALAVKRGEIAVLTEKLQSDGFLAWDVPEGEWRIVRVGYSCTADKVSTSSPTWRGLTLDYLSRDAFDFYWAKVVEPILARAGRHVGKTLKFMETDSWECGGMNWSEGFETHFRDFAGYDLTPFLIAHAGHVIDDMATTMAFLADFRRAVADAIYRNHYLRFAEKAHERGMGIQPESAGPHAGPLDGIRNYSASDIVMSEFWAMSPHRPTPEKRFFVKQASSAAHVYGKRIVGAEAFTTIGPHWNDLIGSNQKPAFDHEICSGLNRVYLHTFTSSPKQHGRPGLEYFAGTHINDRVTWWDEGAAFIDYMRRVQSVVQRLDFVADVLYFYGEHVPNIYPLKEADMARVLPGFDYDVIDAAGMKMLRHKDGRVIAPSGRKYRLLAMPGEIGPSARERLLAMGIPPDFSTTAPSNSLDYIHYAADDGDVYFVSNQSGAEISCECSFRAVGIAAEMWTPLDGARRAVRFAHGDGRISTIKLHFNPFEAYFVVFRNDTKGACKADEPHKPPLRAMTLDGAWSVEFARQCGGLEIVDFPTLRDWTEFDEPQIKFYSGAATYRKDFDFAKDGSKEYRIELGCVLDTGFAHVRLNGRDLGTVWTPPYSADITAALADGTNTLEITVINSWHNRVIGDQRGIFSQPLTKTNIDLSDPAKHSLSPSGLIGPVKIVEE